MKFILNELYKEYEGDTEQVLNDLFKKILTMSDEEIMKLKPHGVTTSFSSYGPYYITKNKLINISDSVNEFYDNMGTTHAEWLAELMDETFDKYFHTTEEFQDYYLYNIIDDAWEYASDNLEDFEDNQGWVRVNAGGESADERFYCSLPDKPLNSTQYDYLQKFFEFGYDSEKSEIQIYAGKEYQKYDLNEMLPEDIIKRIKRYYSSGKLYEDYLDSEEKFHDYKTGTVDGNNLFDTHKTGMSFYDDFLNDLDYMQKNKNLTGKIVMMSPKEYFEGCAKIFNSSTQKQIEGTKADTNTINHLKEVVLKYKKQFPITFLNYANGGQEGRHRMYVAAELTSWDTKFPVLIIDWYDKEKAARDAEKEMQDDIFNHIRKAYEEAIKYKYKDLDDFKTQLIYEMEDQFEDFDKKSFELVDMQNGRYEIHYKDVGFSFEPEDIQYKNQSDNEEDNNLILPEDDFDLDDWDDFETWWNKEGSKL